MHRIHNYTIDKEPIEDMVQARRYNPCLRITFRDSTGNHTHNLSAGTNDVIDVYRELTETYVLSSNSRLEYVGLEIFVGAGKQGVIFLQGDQVKEALGRENLASYNVIKRLREHHPITRKTTRIIKLTAFLETSSEGFFMPKIRRIS